MSIGQALENGFRIGDAFLKGEEVTIRIRIDHWHGVLSWCIPSGDIAAVQYHDDEHYKVTLVTGLTTRRRWGLPEVKDRVYDLESEGTE